MAEIRLAIKSLKCNKSSGLDHITNEMLKYGQYYLLSPICKLFNSVLKLGIFPKQWSSAYIASIYKSRDPLPPENCRGITVLSCLGKLFTKLINTRILDYLESNDILSSSQFGFRQNCRTSDNLFILSTLIDKYVKTGKSTLYTCFIDFKQAFDRVWHEGLFLKLLRTGVNGNIYNVIKSMYANFDLQVKIDDQLSPKFSSVQGVRQDDNLSPTLFNVFLNDLKFH